MKFSFKGKNILITGVSRGIGKAIAKELSSANMCWNYLLRLSLHEPACLRAQLHQPVKSSRPQIFLQRETATNIQQVVEYLVPTT